MCVNAGQSWNLVPKLEPIISPISGMCLFQRPATLVDSQNVAFGQRLQLCFKDVCTGLIVHVVLIRLLWDVGMCVIANIIPGKGLAV